MPYGVIVPEFWDDERLTSLSDSARLLAVFLCTCRQATLVPGLLNLGRGGMIDACRMSAESVDRGMAELTAAGFASFDEKNRVIRVPRAPLHNLPANANMVRAWYRHWRSMPRCEAKNAHLVSLREAIDLAAKKKDVLWPLEIWNQTFKEHAELTQSTVTETVTSTVGERLPERLVEPTGSGSGSGSGYSKRLDAMRRSGPVPLPALQVAKHLALATGQGVSPVELAKWGWEIDRAMREDGATEAGLLGAIDWAETQTTPGAHGFPGWKALIVDAFALTKHQRKLVAQAQAARASPAKPERTDWGAIADELRAKGR